MVTSWAPRAWGLGAGPWPRHEATQGDGRGRVPGPQIVGGGWYLSVGQAIAPSPTGQPIGREGQIMKILTATSRTQGQRNSDFNWCIEGELVHFGLVCAADQDDPDGGCGCGRAFAGL